MAGGAEGRLVSIINVGSQQITLLNESTSSSAANRFTLGGNLTIAAKQAAILRYDGTATRWQSISGGAGLLAANNLSDVASTSAARGNLGIVYPPQGRLTLQTVTPVMNTTQSGKTTIYYTPYAGNQIPIYDGTNMTPSAFAELSVATTDTTKSPAAIGAAKVNDWFVWNDGGTIRLSHGPDWTSDTVRSTGTALVMVNGILLNNAGITNGPAASRGTYVGTTRSNASSQLDWIIGGSAAGGTAAFLNVWNAYNRRPFSAFVQDSTAGWSYTTTSWRSANNSSGNRISFVRGLDEDGVAASYSALAVSTSVGVQLGLGIGLDSGTALAANASSATTYFNTTSNNQIASVSHYSGLPGVGAHFVQALEYGGTSGAFTTNTGITLGGISATLFQ